MILITGMQRSGTSMVCQLLAALGMSFGDAAEHLPGDRWNAAGYFELKEVMDVNSRIITGLPRHRSRFVAWLSKLAYMRMPGAATIAARAERQRSAVTELGQRYRACAVKDPRFCLTLRYWQQWTDVQRVVVCVRDPTAVVESMARRHWLPRWLGARFYAYHVDALLEQLPAHSVLFVDVDRLVAGVAEELDVLRQELDLVAGPPSATLLRDVVRAEVFAAAGSGPDPCPAAAKSAWRRLTAEAAARHTSKANAGPR